MTEERRLAFGVAAPRFGAALEALCIPRILEAGRNLAATLRTVPPEPPCLAEAAALLTGAIRLEDLLAEARRRTDRVFGRSIQLYAPCYLSSFCVSHCLYCGFRFDSKIPRRMLSREEALEEIRLLAGRGMRRILLVAGDFPAKVTPGYIADVIRSARRLVPELDLEVAPGPTRHYRRWRAAGAEGVVCYQEVYDERLYVRLHPRGPKSSYAFRLGTPERAAAGGMTRLGFGVLLGLSPDPVGEILALIAHARFLQDTFPRARITVSLPRLCPAVPSFEPACTISDDSLLRFFAVLRLALPRAGLVLTTREPAAMRRRLLETGVTQMSAGSVTVPGGYGQEANGDPGQFEVSDHRPIPEVVSDLKAAGYQVRWTLEEAGRAGKGVRGASRGPGRG